MTHFADKKNSDNQAGWIFVITWLLIALLVMFDGLVLSILWNWFIPNIFHGLPSLRIGEAIGLSLVVTAFVRRPSRKKEDSADLADGFRNYIMHVIMLLGTGFIVQAIVF